MSEHDDESKRYSERHDAPREDRSVQQTPDQDGVETSLGPNQDTVSEAPQPESQSDHSPEPEIQQGHEQRPEYPTQHETRPSKKSPPAQRLSPGNFNTKDHDDYQAVGLPEGTSAHRTPDKPKPESDLERRPDRSIMDAEDRKQDQDAKDTGRKDQDSKRRQNGQLRKNHYSPRARTLRRDAPGRNPGQKQNPIQQRRKPGQQSDRQGRNPNHPNYGDGVIPGAPAGKRSDQRQPDRQDDRKQNSPVAAPLKKEHERGGKHDDPNKIGPDARDRNKSSRAGSSPKRSSPLSDRKDPGRNKKDKSQSNKRRNQQPGMMRSAMHRATSTMRGKIALTTAGTALGMILVGALFLVAIVAQIATTGGAGSVLTDDVKDDDLTDDSMQCSMDGDSDELGAPEEWHEYIMEAADTSGVPADIIDAQLDQEAGYETDLTSPAGADGPAQFMPETWKSYGDGGDIRDPADAVPALGRYLKDMMAHVEGIADDETEQVELALAAYNAGPGNVDKYNGIPPFKETKDYVEIITSNASSDAFAVNCSASSGKALSVDGVGKDDYPYREPKGTKGWSFPRSDFGHTQRECTDFVMWRINQSMGWSPGDDEDPPFTFSKLGVSYSGGGSGAGSWMDILTSVDGIESADDPQPGDIAWWGYNDIGGGFGHVGFVAEVDGSQVTIEHYNYTNVSAYSSSTHEVNEVPGFIRVSDDVKE